MSTNIKLDESVANNDKNKLKNILTSIRDSVDKLNDDFNDILDEDNWRGPRRDSITFYNLSTFYGSTSSNLADSIDEQINKYDKFLQEAISSTFEADDSASSVIKAGVDSSAAKKTSTNGGSSETSSSNKESNASNNNNQSDKSKSDDSSSKTVGGYKLSYSGKYETSGTRLNTQNGRITYNGHSETYYSTCEPGQTVTAKEIPGKHVAEDGTIRDKDGYICLAMPLSTSERERYGYHYYDVVMTSLGPGKIYDCGTTGNTIDIYTNWPA